MDLKRGCLVLALPNDCGTSSCHLVPGSPCLPQANFHVSIKTLSISCGLYVRKFCRLFTHSVPYLVIITIPLLQKEETGKTEIK